MKMIVKIRIIVRVDLLSTEQEDISCQPGRSKVCSSQKRL